MNIIIAKVLIGGIWLALVLMYCWFSVKHNNKENEN